MSPEKEKAAATKTAELEAAFAEIEQAAEVSAPGVMELLQVYGGYEAAIRQADAYLAATTPRAAYSVTDTTG